MAGMCYVSFIISPLFNLTMASEQCERAPELKAQAVREARERERSEKAVERSGIYYITFLAFEARSVSSSFLGMIKVSIST